MRRTTENRFQVQSERTAPHQGLLLGALIGRFVDTDMVNVLFFGAVFAATGTKSLKLELGSPRPAKEVLDEIVAQFPVLEKQRLLMAVNQEYSGGNEMLRDGDEFAIFTPVSGG